MADRSEMTRGDHRGALQFGPSHLYSQVTRFYLVFSATHRYPNVFLLACKSLSNFSYLFLHPPVPMMLNLGIYLVY